MPFSTCPAGRWCLSLNPDNRDPLKMALCHHRLDLFYGPHYLRFTRTEGLNGESILRLEERARLEDTSAFTALAIVTGEAPQRRFVYQETLLAPRRSGAHTGSREMVDPIAWSRARAFFDHAAATLDRQDVQT